MFTIKSPKVLSKLAQGYAASESTRYAINGVLIEPHNGRALAIATDGRKLCMGIVGDADADAHRAILETKPVVDAVKLAKSRFTPNLRMTNGTPGQIVAQASRDTEEGQSAEGGTAVCAEIEGNFPNYRDVCESKTPPFRMAVSPALLIDALKAFVEAAGEENRGVAIHFTDSTTPMHLVGGTSDNPLYAILMPVSVESYGAGEGGAAFIARSAATAERTATEKRKAFGLSV